MTDRIARIAGIGSCLPDRILSNDDLAAMVDTSDSWIRERTGIRQRHIAPEGVTTADLGEQAARRAQQYTCSFAWASQLMPTRSVRTCSQRRQT